MLAFVLLLLWSGSVLHAQAPQFSQFYASPLYLAPSFAGGTDGSRLSVNYRNQWPEIPGAFVTYAVGLDHYFHNYRSGAGILLFRDQAGSGRLATTAASLMYSYNFQIDHNWTIRPGIGFQYAQRSVDFDRHIFGDQLSLDGINPTTLVVRPIEQIGYFDAASSVLVYSPAIWGGLAVDHMMRPNQSMTGDESRIPAKISVFGGYRYRYGGTYAQQVDESISVAFLYKNQGKFHQFDLGTYWTKDPISLGLLYRGIPLFNNEVSKFTNNDAMVLLAGIRKDNLRIGYSYDFTISGLRSSTGGAHEVSLIFQFNQGPPAKKQGMIPCPVQ